MPADCRLDQRPLPLDNAATDVSIAFARPDIGLMLSKKYSQTTRTIVGDKKQRFSWPMATLFMPD